jgi:HlyD family secretion protein
MKKILIPVGIAAVAAAVVVLVLTSPRGKTPLYVTAKVTRGDIVMDVTASGTVNPVTTVLVGTQVSGTIKNIYVDFNSPVKKGQLIAMIDPAPFQAQVQEAEANLDAAQANQEKAQAALDQAELTLKRDKELLSKNLIARSTVDTDQTSYETAKAALDAARAQTEQTKAALDLSQTSLQYTRITSPVNGIVVSKSIDVGQTVAASFQTPTLFTIAQDLTKMQIDTSVDEADIGHVKMGEESTFTVDAYPDTHFKGVVRQVRIAPTTVQNVVTYDVVISVDNKDLKLLPGMTADVSITTQNRENVLRIPNTALLFRPVIKGKLAPLEKGYGVWVLEEGKLKRVPVTLGISDGTYTELVSGDVKEGEEVVVGYREQPKVSGSSGRRLF